VVAALRPPVLTGFLCIQVVVFAYSFMTIATLVYGCLTVRPLLQRWGAAQPGS
jgi:hypothetical protein